MTNPSSVIWDLIAQPTLLFLAVSMSVRSLSPSLSPCLTHMCTHTWRKTAAQQEEVKQVTICNTHTCTVAGLWLTLLFHWGQQAAYNPGHFCRPQEFYNKPRAFISECPSGSAEPWPGFPGRCGWEPCPVLTPSPVHTGWRTEEGFCPSGFLQAEGSWVSPFQVIVTTWKPLGSLSVQTLAMWAGHLPYHKFLICSHLAISHHEQYVLQPHAPPNLFCI